MVFSIFDQYTELRCPAADCQRPAAYIEIAEPQFDTVGMLIDGQPSVAVCWEHQSDRAHTREVNDCSNRGCGPDHCEFPACKLPVMPEQPASVPSAITREKYLAILGSYGIDPPSFVSASLGTHGFDVDTYYLDEAGNKMYEPLTGAPVTMTDYVAVYDVAAGGPQQLPARYAPRSITREQYLDPLTDGGFVLDHIAWMEIQHHRIVSSVYSLDCDGHIIVDADGEPVTYETTTVVLGNKGVFMPKANPDQP